MNPFLRGSTRPRRVSVFGHRGAAGLAPENTLESFELAFDLGVDGVELDVHLTKDGKLVVIHDDRLGRTTDHPERPWVSDVTLDEIQALDAGSWFVRALEKRKPGGPTPEEERRFLGKDALARYASGKVRVPALEEVLELARRRRRHVDVELKTIPRFYEGLAGEAVALVKRLGVEDLVFFSSFDHQAIAEAKRLAPGIPGACLEVSRLHRPGRYVAEIVGADLWEPSCVPEIDTLGFASTGHEARGDDALDRASVEDAHDHGVGVFVWTVNDPERARALAALGVDGVFTDYPDRLVGLAT